MPISRTGSRHGFTLIELMVTLVIMVLISGVALVSLQPALANARLRSGARIVIAALRYARSYAVAQRTEAAVVFDTERQGVSVEIREVDDEGTESWRTITTQAGRFRALPNGITFAEVTTQAEDETGEETDTEEEAVTVTFNPLGRGEDAYIVLEDDKERQRFIRVDAVTGQCEMVDETP